MIRAALIAAVVLAGCDRVEPRAVVDAVAAPVEGSAPNVEALAADPAALRRVRAACKADPGETLSPTCAAAAEATRRRFAGRPSTYRPEPIDPFAPGPDLAPDETRP